MYIPEEDLPALAYPIGSSMGLLTGARIYDVNLRVHGVYLSMYQGYMAKLPTLYNTISSKE